MSDYNEQAERFLVELQKGFAPLGWDWHADVGASVSSFTAVSSAGGGVGVPLHELAIAKMALCDLGFGVPAGDGRTFVQSNKFGSFHGADTAWKGIVVPVLSIRERHLAMQYGIGSQLEKKVHRHLSAAQPDIDFLSMKCAFSRAWDLTL